MQCQAHNVKARCSICAALTARSGSFQCIHRACVVAVLSLQHLVLHFTNGFLRYSGNKMCASSSVEMRPTLSCILLHLALDFLCLLGVPAPVGIPTISCCVSWLAVTICTMSSSGSASQPFFKVLRLRGCSAKAPLLGDREAKVWWQSTFAHFWMLLRKRLEHP